MAFTFDTNNIIGLPEPEKAVLAQLWSIYSSHLSANDQKERYYEGNIPLSEVNLGIALPQGMRGLEIGCSWGAKAVDVLAARSMFDGFVGVNGEDVSQLNTLAENNRLVAEYPRAVRDELKFGCTFATLSRDDVLGCKIRFHSPRSAAARWNGEKGRIDAGFAIIDTAPDNNSANTWTPSLINLYTDDAVWVLQRSGQQWQTKKHENKMGRPLMEPLIWNPTSAKPFGRSRIKGYVRKLMKGYVRTIANATIGLEFSTTPQKYLLGITDEQYEKVINQKFKQYVGSIIAATYNPDNGEKPTFGQLSQGSISPHVEMLRVLATQFSAATGLSVMDTGVVNDANPTSSDALEAQTKNLVALAEELNTGNAAALKNIALMALAIAHDVPLAELPEKETSVMARFKNPAMPSIAATADAAMKIVSARPGFAQTDAFLEMVGFDNATIRRINGQERRARGQQVLTEEFSE